MHRIRGGRPILKKGGSVKFLEVTVDYLIFKLLQDKYFIFQWKSNMSNIWGQTIYFIWNRFIDFQLLIDIIFTSLPPFRRIKWSSPDLDFFYLYV